MIKDPIAEGEATHWAIPALADFECRHGNLPGTKECDCHDETRWLGDGDGSDDLVADLTAAAVRAGERSWLEDYLERHSAA